MKPRKNHLQLRHSNRSSCVDILSVFLSETYVTVKRKSPCVSPGVCLIISLGTEGGCPAFLPLDVIFFG